jgi:uncharacterized protein YeeX (DUF496 family)
MARKPEEFTHIVNSKVEFLLIYSDFEKRLDGYVIGNSEVQRLQSVQKKN